jgi:hypothetical protein
MDLSQYIKSDEGDFDNMSNQEQSLAMLVAEILDIDVKSLSSRSDFFAIGGDSITAILLSQRMTGIDMKASTKDIFTRRTIGLIVKYCMKNASDNDILIKKLTCPPEVSQEILLKLNVQGQECDMYPCTTLQAAMFSSTVEDPSAYVAQMVWKIGSKITKQVLFEAWKRVIQSHDILHSTFVQTTRNAVYQVVLKNQAITLKTSSLDLQSTLQNSLKRGYVEGDLQWIDLTFVEENALKESFFILKMHHCLYDGWTMGLYMRDLDLALKGTPIPTPVPFKRYVEAIESIDKDSIKSFWTNYLQDISPPALFSRKLDLEGSSSNSANLSISANDLNLATRNAKCTSSSLFKTAWGLTLQVFSQTKDIAFAEVVSGRDLSVSGIDRY